MGASAFASWWPCSACSRCWSGLVSLAPYEAGGLALVVLSVVGARVLWAGILTVRAAVWTANYPRNVLARITGRIVIVSSLAVAGSAGLVGWSLEDARARSALAVLRRSGRRTDRGVALPDGARAPRVSPACRRGRGRAAQRAIQPAHAARDPRRRIRRSAATCSGWACSAAAISCSPRNWCWCSPSSCIFRAPSRLRYSPWCRS